LRARSIGVVHLALLAFLGGCSYFIPASGPATEDVREGPAPLQPASLPYALVPMTPKVLNVLAANTPRLSAAFGDRRGPTDLRFGVGDVATVTIYEAAAGGLFIPARPESARGISSPCPPRRWIATATLRSRTLGPFELQVAPK